MQPRIPKHWPPQCCFQVAAQSDDGTVASPWSGLTNAVAVGEWQPHHQLALQYEDQLSWPCIPRIFSVVVQPAFASLLGHLPAGTPAGPEITSSQGDVTSVIVRWNRVNTAKE